jgi:hypothetical protein
LHKITPQQACRILSVMSLAPAIPNVAAATPERCKRSFPNVRFAMDAICLIKSMKNDFPNHREGTMVVHGGNGASVPFKVSNACRRFLLHPESGFEGFHAGSE